VNAACLHAADQLVEHAPGSDSQYEQLAMAAACLVRGLHQDGGAALAGIRSRHDKEKPATLASVRVSKAW